MRSLLALLVVSSCFVGGVVEADQSAFFGRWTGDTDPGAFHGFISQMTPTHVDIGADKECRNLTYRVIETYRSDEYSDYMSIDIVAPKDSCRWYGQKEVIFRLRLLRGPYRMLGIYICPSKEDLQRFVSEDGHHLCSGEANLTPLPTE